jgi:hypothetical protein
MEKSTVPTFKVLSFSAKRRKIWVRRESGSFSGDLEAQVILEGT